MEFFEVLESRRSVRRFDGRAVSDEQLLRILEAARCAPSGGNMQPWELIVLRERESIRLAVDTTFVGFDPSSGRRQEWLLGAALLIVACADLKRSSSRYGQMGARVAVLDTAAAVENMLLAAVALGLGSCWVSGFDTRALGRLLRLPEFVQPLAILPLGFPVDIPAAPPRFALADIAHRERYGQAYM
jgi:nitroreductase